VRHEWDEERTGVLEGPGRVPMKPLARERYDAMVESHRREPGNHQAAATAASANWRTAQKMWEVGQPTRGYPPIKDVIAHEQTIRRALTAESVEAHQAESARLRLELREEAAQIRDAINTEREDMQRQRLELETLASRVAEGAQRAKTALVDRGVADAQATRMQETTWVRSVRAYNLSVLGILQGMLRPAAVANLGRALERAATDGTIDSREALRLTRALVGFAKPLVEAAKLGLESERLAAGQPTAIIEHHHEVTLEPAELAAKRLEYERIMAQLEEHMQPPVEDAEDAEVVEPAALPAPAPAHPAEPLPLEEALARAEAHWDEREGGCSVSETDRPPFG
jgi:hypothetical protein